MKYSELDCSRDKGDFSRLQRSLVLKIQSGGRLETSRDKGDCRDTGDLKYSEVDC